MPPEVSTPAADQDLGRRVGELERELAEAREQQAATSEILRVISSSPTDVQPVFDAIAANAVRLLGGRSSAVTRVIGDIVHLIAHNSTDGSEALRSYYPLPLSSVPHIARVVRSGKSAFRSDTEDDPETLPETKALARARGYRSVLWVPLMREGVAFGTINVSRAEPGPFSDHQIKLLETFADQAVIAIENTRLFEAEQASKRELQASLEYQTATSEVLDVISRSPTDVQPVFDMIAQSAARLCDGLYSVVFRFDGEMITVAAESGVSPRTSAIIRSAYPAPPGRGSMASRALLERRVIAMTDAQDSVANPDGAERARAIGYRAGLSVPMLRGDTAIGAITVVRREAMPFTDTQIELLKTFADQAVIAIENTRLFEEVQARTRELHRVARIPNRDQRRARRHLALDHHKCSQSSIRLPVLRRRLCRG